MRAFKFSFVLFTLFAVAAPAQAYYDYRLSVGAGIVQFNNPSQTYVDIGAEYEYRFQPLLGVGAFANYIFSTPSITLIGVPEVFLHPLGGDWLLKASPLIEFGSGISTQTGVRVGTRLPIPLGPVSFIPEASVDFIGGRRILRLGLGLQF